MTQYFIDNQGKYIGGFDGAEPPRNSIEIPNPPNDGRDIFDFNTKQWIPYQPSVKELIMPTDPDMARVAEDLLIALIKATGFPISIPQETIDKVNKRLQIRGEPLL